MGTLSVVQGRVVGRPPRHIGEWVRTQRLQRGWTQSAFASRSGIDQSTISMLENGTKFVAKPTVPSLQRLAHGLARDESELAPLFLELLGMAGIEPGMLAAIRDFGGAMTRGQAAGDSEPA